MLMLLTYLAAAAAGAVIGGLAIARRPAEKKRAELAAQRVARMFAALSDTNEAIMRVA